jgi:hypothetical protein
MQFEQKLQKEKIKFNAKYPENRGITRAHVTKAHHNNNVVC